jgi:uncharacterized RDD family membrane protein YckC
MTQQDETGQGAAMQQPAAPSPYLYGGESVQQAYPAPPQPGKPSYGTPPAHRAGPLQGGSRQERYGQPGRQGRRDPALAAPWERLIASALDWLIIFVVSVLALWSPLTRVLREFQAITTSHPDANSPAAQAALDSIFRDPSNQHTLLYWFLATFSIALVYYWVQHAAWGATIGKRVLGVQVVQAGDRSSLGVWQAGLRAVAFLAGPAVFLSPLASLIEIAGGLLWVADAGLSLLDPQAQCLHDKLAGTIVIRQRWLARQAREDRSW